MRGLEGGRWYVVHSKPQKERFAEVHLRLRGVDVFLPQLLLPQYVERRPRVVPLFPNYLFVRIRLPEQYYCVLWTPGIRCFVSFNGTPAPLDDEVVTLLARHAGPDGTIAARPNLRVGQEVTIAGGPFDGLVGIIERPPDARGRVKLLMTLVSAQAVRLDMAVQSVKSAWLADAGGARTDT